MGNIGYDGPQGPIGRKYRYRIRLLALDSASEAGPGLDRRAFEKAIEGHVLSEAVLHACYERHD